MMRRSMGKAPEIRSEPEPKRVFARRNTAAKAAK